MNGRYLPLATPYGNRLLGVPWAPVEALKSGEDPDPDRPRRGAAAAARAETPGCRSRPGGAAAAARAETPGCRSPQGRRSPRGLGLYDSSGAGCLLHSGLPGPAEKRRRRLTAPRASYRAPERFRDSGADSAAGECGCDRTAARR
jgi:hypothetical protein